jgi:hypothetical protein
MRLEIRTLTRTISALLVAVLLIGCMALSASAQGRRRSRIMTRHDNGRHLGWTIGRHRGWSNSRHLGVRRNSDTLGVFRRNRRMDNRDIIRRRDRGELRRRDRIFERNDRFERGDRNAVGDRVGFGRGHGEGRGRGHGKH